MYNIYIYIYIYIVVYIRRKDIIYIYCCILQGKRSIRYVLAYANVLNNLVKKELYMSSMGYRYEGIYIYI